MTRSQDQFAPTEDLSKYPRTLAKDLELLSTLLPPPIQSKAQEHVSEKKVESPLVIFNPPEEVMYPLRGNLQDLSQKKGVEVDVKGWGNVMEGASRRKSRSRNLGFGTGTWNGADHLAQFFKGVATVCTKLFNAVEVRLVHLALGL
jgi:pantoate--beta-alanine ligase